jgi:hypothetical protein
MTSRLVRNLKSVAGTVAAAVRAGSAVENGLRPRREDLDTLGIDGAAFRSIGR